MKTLLVWICLWVIANGIGHSQESGALVPGSPEAAANGQIAAMRATDWQKFTAHMHPKALARFKELMLPVAAALTKNEDPNVRKIRTVLFADIPLERLQASPPDIFFERFMQNFAKTNPGFIEGYKTTTVEYLGQVREGATTHLVLRYTREVAGTKVREVSAASFEQDAGEWKALLSGEIEQLAARLRAQFLHEK